MTAVLVFIIGMLVCTVLICYTREDEKDETD